MSPRQSPTFVTLITSTRNVSHTEYLMRRHPFGCYSWGVLLLTRFPRYYFTVHQSLATSFTHQNIVNLADISSTLVCHQVFISSFKIGIDKSKFQVFSSSLILHFLLTCLINCNDINLHEKYLGETPLCIEAVYLRNRKRFPRSHTVIETRVDVWENQKLKWEHDLPG